MSQLYKLRDDVYVDLSHIVATQYNEGSRCNNSGPYISVYTTDGGRFNVPCVTENGRGEYFKLVNLINDWKAR